VHHHITPVQWQALEQAAIDAEPRRTQANGIVQFTLSSIDQYSLRLMHCLHVRIWCHPDEERHDCFKQLRLKFKDVVAVYRPFWPSTRVTMLLRALTVR
jgi:hypothetical protein